MRRLSFVIFYLSFSVALFLLTACSDDKATDEALQPLPEGMGRIRITLSVPETAGRTTRAVNPVPWEDPDHNWETLKTFRIFICKASTTETGKYEVVECIEGTDEDLELKEHDPATSESTSMVSTHKYTVVSQMLGEGTYYLFATANFPANVDFGKEDNNIIDAEEIRRFANSSYYYIVGDDTKYSMTSIPMTGWQPQNRNGKLVPTPISVSNGIETDAGVLSLWRVIGKMQFEFTNESNKDIRILGVEVDPINKVTVGTDYTNPGIYLFSRDDLESTDNLAPGGVSLPEATKIDTGAVSFTPALVNNIAEPLVLAAKNDGSTDEGKIYFYVNETSATFTTSQNQLSLRFKLQRKKDNDTWYDEEIRYGVTTQHDGTNSGAYGGYNGGFNVIRRNDWIHIPVTLTDWQLRVEPLALVPIAGYPAKTLSSDGLTATFSTGGRIILQPFVKKYDDTSWRDFSDPLITWWDEHEVKKSDNTTPDEAASWDASIHWKNADGTNVSGDDKIIKTPFTFDDVNHCIVGELNQAKVGSNAKTTITLDVKLGDYKYSFTFNIVLQ